MSISNERSGSSLRKVQTSTIRAASTITVTSPRNTTVSTIAPPKRALSASAAFSASGCGTSQRADADDTLIPGSLPFQAAAAPAVHVPHDEDAQEDEHLGEAEEPHATEEDRPRVQEGGLDVEEDEEHRDDVEADRRALAGRVDHGDPALV